MNLGRSLRRLAPIGLWMAMLAPVVAAGPDDPGRRDCGTNALFLLFEIEGLPITLDRLDTALPPRHRDGYSMAELAEASRVLGLRLDGIQLDRRGTRPDRPVIAFFKDAKGGHFAVLRPVGTTGAMCQVLDPPHALRLIDYAEVARMPTWTGRVLFPADPWAIRNATPLLAGAAGVSLLVGVIRVRGRRRSRGEAISSTNASRAS